MARQSWLFQANPDQFDIDAFLATRPPSFLWVVTRYKDRIAPGDQVFIWRAAGTESSTPSGIIAEAVVVTKPTRQPDDDLSLPFWRTPQSSAVEADRARLQVLRVASIRERLRRDWLREDPVLKDLLILKMANATNYELNPEHSARLNALWSKTGRDWNYSESVAGLWAYQKTYGGEVSRVPDSPVATVALRIGRAVSGVYNKVMNFRAIDPRETRAGMSGGSTVDRNVWAQFFDFSLGTVRVDELEREFERLWGDDITANSGSDAGEIDRAIDEEANSLTKFGIDQLMARYAAQARHPKGKPGVRSATTQVFDRSPLVIAIAKMRANFSCEVPNCTHPQFRNIRGDPYCEVHHIRPLSDGGDDTLENAACLCPSHHREAHHGVSASNIREVLSLLRRS